VFFLVAVLGAAGKREKKKEGEFIFAFFEIQ
jgi:hypothetical protein